MAGLGVFLCRCPFPGLRFGGPSFSPDVQGPQPSGEPPGSASLGGKAPVAGGSVRESRDRCCDPAEGVPGAGRFHGATYRRGALGLILSFCLFRLWLRRKIAWGGSRWILSAPLTYSASLMALSPLSLEAIIKTPRFIGAETLSFTQTFALGWGKGRGGKGEGQPILPSPAPPERWERAGPGLGGGSW